MCKAESGREREDALIQKGGLGKVSRPRARARRQINLTKKPNPKQKKTHGSALRKPELKKKHEMEEIKKTEANAEWFSS